MKFTFLLLKMSPTESYIISVPFQCSRAFAIATAIVSPHASESELLQRCQECSWVIYPQIAELGTLKTSLGNLARFAIPAKTYRVFFFNWPPPSILAPPQNASNGPPLDFLSVGITFTSPDTQVFSEGGPVWDSNIFLKSVTYRPTLSKFRGGPVKKNTLYTCHV